MSGDLGAVPGVDVVEVDSASEQAVVVLAEGAEQRVCSAVLRVGAQAAQQGGDSCGDGALHVCGIGPQLLGQLVDGQGGEDLVGGGHGGPSGWDAGDNACGANYGRAHGRRVASGPFVDR